MRHLYVLLPGTEICKKVVNELEELSIPKHHMHVIASLSHNLKGLPQATVWQKTELAHSITWGAILGGTAGLLGCVLAIIFPPPGLVLGDDAILACIIAGAVLGSMISAILGSHEHNHALDKFRTQIINGQILLMLDIPRRRVEVVQRLIRNHHPQADITVTDIKNR